MRASIKFLSISSIRRGAQKIVILYIFFWFFPAFAFDYDVVEKNVQDLQADLSEGKVTSVQLVKAYLKRIELMDQNGPELHSLITINPEALKQAEELDKERIAGKVRSILHGLPIVLKDNIESADPMPTTNGSMALKDNIVYRDSGVAERLRSAGVIILAKSNLSNWSEIQSSYAIGGWSAIGGLVRNPYVLDRTACGSSSGSAVATAASLIAFAIGTETDNSIICPASAAGLVALKPTVGLVSRTGIIPISTAQDTPGPMGRTVFDVAALLTIIAGRDPEDESTNFADDHKLDYTSLLKHENLDDYRLGVLSYAMGRVVKVDEVFNRALVDLRELGAEIVFLDDFIPDPRLRPLETRVMLTDFRININKYLPTTSKEVKVKSLADLIEYNKTADRELELFGQDLFVATEKTSKVPIEEHLKLGQEIKKIARQEGIDRLLEQYNLDALIAPSLAPAGKVDVVRGDHPSLGVSNMAAVAGYPHLTVPMGFVGPLPVGISFMGKAWSDGLLLSLASAYERKTQARKPPKYIQSVETENDLQEIFQPRNVDGK